MLLAGGICSKLELVAVACGRRQTASSCSSVQLEIEDPIPNPRIPASLRLIAITDDLRDGVDGLVGRARAAARGGATMIQLRLKDVDSRELVAIARALVAALPVPVIVNDRADV